MWIFVTPSMWIKRSTETNMGNNVINLCTIKMTCCKLCWISLITAAILTTIAPPSVRALPAMIRGAHGPDVLVSDQIPSRKYNNTLPGKV